MDDLKRANESYAAALACAREWQNVDRITAGEVIAILLRASKKKLGAAEAAELLGKLHAMSPSEVTTTKVSKLEDQLARIRAIAAGEHD